MQSFLIFKLFQLHDNQDGFKKKVKIITRRNLIVNVSTIFMKFQIALIGLRKISLYEHSNICSYRLTFLHSVHLKFCGNTYKMERKVFLILINSLVKYLKLFRVFVPRNHPQELLNNIKTFNSLQCIDPDFHYCLGIRSGNLFTT